MAELLHGPWSSGVSPDGAPGRADGPQGQVDSRTREIEEGVAALRREAVVAVVRQQEIEARLAPVREETSRIEWEAVRALQRGQERLARQILHRQLGTLALGDCLRDELTQARRRTIRLLESAVRLEERARHARRADDEWAGPSGARARHDGPVKPPEP